MDPKIKPTSDDVDALRRLLTNLESDLMGRLPAQTVADSIVHSNELVRMAKKLLLARRNRTHHFKPSMFSEPAWDMLLVLYANENETRLKVGRLAARSGSKATTALRWLDYLSREEFVCRRPNFNDARSEFVELTDKGRTVLERYLSETLQFLR